MNITLTLHYEARLENYFFEAKNLRLYIKSI